MDVASYNGVMHLASLRAAAALAEVVEDKGWIPVLDAAVVRGQHAMATLLWRGRVSDGDNASYVRTGWTNTTASKRSRASTLKGGAGRTALRFDRLYNDTLLTDTLYGQVWAHYLGLGWLLPARNVTDHLAAELRCVSKIRNPQCTLFGYLYGEASFISYIRYQIPSFHRHHLELASCKSQH
jgi:hypothetical protein